MRSSTPTDIAQLVADGLLPRSDAVPRLEQLQDQLNELEQPANSGPVRSNDLIDPHEAWESWSTVQRREVIRLLFETLSIKHGSHHTGPRADLSRLHVEWAH